MKARTRLYATGLLALALAACSQDEQQDEQHDSAPAVALGVTAGIDQAATRASIDSDDPTKASFAAGDEINVVADGTGTYVYTLQSDGTTWNALTPYYFQDHNDVKFRAWYAVPELTAENGAIAIDTETQKYSDDGWNNWDILATPEVTTSVSTPSVAFTGNNAFQHLMSQVTMVFTTGSGISSLTALTGYTLKSLTTNATFSTTECKLTAGTTTGNVTVGVEVKDATVTQYSCPPIILVPQEITGNIDIEVSYNEQTYNASLTPPTDGLQPGYSYTYTVTINNTGLTVSTASIGNWTAATGGSGNATL